jgi:hypothetical protein
VARYFKYPCPGCRSTNDLHDFDCKFTGTPWFDVEKAYTDIVGALADGAKTEEELRAAAHGDWDSLHQAAFQELRTTRRVDETTDESGREVLELVTPDEYRERLAHPPHDPVKTIYEEGSVPGAHDNSVFAMVAYYEMIGLTWEETREKVVDWLIESGTWQRGGFEEESPEELVDSKRHVHEQGYGWKEKAKAAKAVIDRRV